MAWDLLISGFTNTGVAAERVQITPPLGDALSAFAGKLCWLQILECWQVGARV